ncbi:class I SAM-dependent methyltransferase, partial [Acidisphaera rubrifaciens]|uniref:class I SAM-dependent methyltransferase n=1 Tax=Acidisphaera rubrifaciens TaxID=50715 RepID=UPI0006623186
MSDWNHGYVTDLGYTTNIYREFTPAWLAFAALLLGQRPPDLARPVRMAELGCGYGLTLAVAAANAPDSAFFGYDFNPAHVEAARLFADAAGLANLHVEERAIADLAAPDGAGADLDIIALHGVWSWVDDTVRADIVRFITSRLRPGGLVFVSYNVLTGFADMLPVRTLMRQVAAREARSDLAVAAVRPALERLRAGAQAYFAAHPALEQRLAGLASMDARYLAHEYLNADWAPTMFADVAAAMAGARCQYVGSATLPDNVDATSAPPTMVPLLAEQRDVVLRETLRDFGCGQSFRRDIYRRGHAPLPPAEHRALLDAVHFVDLGRHREAEVKVACSIGQLSGRPEIYDPLLDRLAAGPLSVAEAREMSPFAGRPIQELVQALLMVTAAGYAHPVAAGAGSPAARAAGRRANAEIARLNRLGGAIPHLVAPASGASVLADLAETLAVGALLAGAPRDEQALATEVDTALAATGRGPA